MIDFGTVLDEAWVIARVRLEMEAKESVAELRLVGGEAGAIGETILKEIADVTNRVSLGEISAKQGKEIVSRLLGSLDNLADGVAEAARKEAIKDARVVLGVVLDIAVMVAEASAGPIAGRMANEIRKKMGI
jgi:Asp-tRNA(Asn)/Glu-tRNA(Gln) amidotransferase B subunit